MHAIMQSKHAILLGTGNTEAADSLREVFRHKYQVDVATAKLECLNWSKRRHYEFLVLDIALLLPENGVKTDQSHYRGELTPFWLLLPNTDIIVMTRQETIREAVLAVKAGAADYVTFPVDPEEISLVTERIFEDKRNASELDYLRDRFWARDSHDLAPTHSPMMETVLDKLRSVSPTRTTVMLYGETGTGKGVIARLIHRHSNRRGHQFIGVHCGAITETLVESELFGHDKGAFTGAFKRKLGKFEIASGGTIFLDEIGTISSSTQIKLLQVLQDHSFQRVGGEETIECDARVIAATNMNLKEMVDSGSFRRDLYYRLNVFPIEVPSLRERKEDIPLLAETFLKRLNLLYGKEIHGIHSQVIEAFQRYNWPGNIRELENLIERAFILETGPVLTPDVFPVDLFEADRQEVAGACLNPCGTLAEVRALGVERIEKQYLAEVLTANRGRISESAKQAGISTRQLHKLLTKYGIRKEAFKALSAV
jgi:DNA-binding NtrC family response regulator